MAIHGIMTAGLCEKKRRKAVWSVSFKFRLDESDGRKTKIGGAEKRKGKGTHIMMQYMP
jgi:hypothetical protein